MYVLRIGPYWTMENRKKNNTQNVGYITGGLSWRWCQTHQFNCYTHSTQHTHTGQNWDWPINRLHSVQFSFVFFFFVIFFFSILLSESTAYAEMHACIVYLNSNAVFSCCCFLFVFSLSFTLYSQSFFFFSRFFSSILFSYALEDHCIVLAVTFFYYWDFCSL